jgi:hypothetical protein
MSSDCPELRNEAPRADYLPAAPVERLVNGESPQLIWRT